MRWLITGGCGFIGTSLIRKLREEGGHGIRVLDNLSVGTRDDLASTCEFTEIGTDGLRDGPDDGECQLVVGDILDASLAMQAARGMDVVVHLAANTGVGPSVEDPRQDCVTNVLGTFNYLEAARHAGVRRFVFASSGAPVGECNPPIHEEMPAHPVSPYGASKLAGEGYCSAYFRSFGLATVCLRFGNVYGPGSGHKFSVVAKFIKQAMNGETLEVYGDGTQTRDFIYIDDLVQAIRLAAHKQGVGGEVFQIATNRETTINELTEALVDELHQAGVEGFSLVNVGERTGDVKRNFSDTSKARRKLGWECKYALHAGLKETVARFVSPPAVD